MSSAERIFNLTDLLLDDIMPRPKQSSSNILNFLGNLVSQPNSISTTSPTSSKLKNNSKDNGSSNEKLNVLIYDPEILLNPQVYLETNSEFNLSIPKSFEEIINELKKTTQPDLLLTSLPNSKAITDLRRINHYDPLFPIILMVNEFDDKKFSNKELKDIESYAPSQIIIPDILKDKDHKNFQESTQDFVIDVKRNYFLRLTDIQLDMQKQSRLEKTIEATWFNLIRYEDEKDNPQFKRSSMERRAKAFEYTNYIYAVRQKSNPGHDILYKVLDEGSTEGGVGKISLTLDGRTYDREWTHFIIKKLSKERARNAKRDSDYFSKTVPELKIEKIKPDLYTDEIDRAYLWKELVPGPDLNNILIWINEETDPDKKKLGNQLKKECYDFVKDAVITWQKKAQHIHKYNNPKTVIDAYRSNLIQILDDFENYTDIKFSTKEKSLYQECVEDLPFEEFITQDTIKRNAAASFRNYILKMNAKSRDGKVKSLSEVLEQITKNGNIDKNAFRDKLILIDTHMKYSFILEDCFEIADHYEGKIEKRFRKGLINSVKNSYPDVTNLLTKGENIIRFYRAIRKTHFFTKTYGSRNFFKYEKGFRDKQTFEERSDIHKENIKHYLSTAISAIYQEINAISSKQDIDKCELEIKHGLYAKQPQITTDRLTKKYKQSISKLEKVIKRQPRNKKAIAKKRIIQLSYLANTYRKLIKFSEFDYTIDQAKKNIEFFD